MSDKNKTLTEQFSIHNFYKTEKGRENRWANQHRWRNGGKKTSVKLKNFLNKQLNKENLTNE